MVSCAEVREALSAQLDDEDPGLPGVRLDAHLRGCAQCRMHAERLAVLNRAVRVRPAEDELRTDRTATILAAINAAGGGGRANRSGDATAVARVALAALGAIQLTYAVPALLTNAGGGHAVRELGAFQAALAVAFFVAAARPNQARGLLPVVAAIALCVTAVAVIDVIAGRVMAGAEATHAVDLLGLALLWQLARPSHLASPYRSARPGSF